jgi:cellulose biosynthesis protein BcsQ
MRLVSFVSFKGGSGKTTALMAIASALVEDGHRIALLEADENRPLAGWRERALEIGTWDEEHCLLLPSDSETALERSFARAETAGCAYALADTAGGGSDLNTTLMVNSEAVIIPSALTTIDLDQALETFEFVDRLPIEDRAIPARLLLTRFPQGRLKSAEQANLDAIGQMPQFAAHLNERGAFADLKATGLLHLYHRRLVSIPARRISAGHIKAAIGETHAVADEMIARMDAAPAPVEG